MGLEIKDIQNAVEKKYSAFSDAVKIELKNKISNHPESKSYATEYDRIQNMKSLFAKINGNTEE